MSTGPANALNITTEGVIYFDGAYTFSGIDASTAGDILTSNGTNTAPSFQVPATQNITITGDVGTATGTNITFDGLTNAGPTVEFSASGTTVSLLTSDANSNTVIGQDSGNTTLLTAASGNTVFGFNSCESLTAAQSNSVFGLNTATLLDTGSFNCFYGAGTGIGVTSGSSNVGIGYQSAGVYNSSESNNICLSNIGVVGDSGVIRIGTIGTQTSAYLAGAAGITTANPSYATVDTVTGQLGSTSVISATYYSLTPFIVGQTGDVNAQYTGDTGVQAAMTAAFTAGATISNPMNVYIKPGTYTPSGGTLTFYDGVNLIGLAPASYGMPQFNNSTVPVDASVTIASVTSTITASTFSLVNINFSSSSLTLENSTVLIVGCFITTLFVDNDSNTNRSFAFIRGSEIFTLQFAGLGEVSCKDSRFDNDIELSTSSSYAIEFEECTFSSNCLIRLNDNTTYDVYFLACSFGTSISFISNSGSLNLFYGACNFADDSFQTSSAFLNYFVFNCTDGTTTYSTNTSSAAGLAFQTSPTDSDTATTALGSLVLGTALQNLTGYDVMLIVYINITVNVSGTISSGVGPTVTPTQQTIVTGVTTLGIVPVTVYLPANYYALISVDVNITATIVGQQATPI